MKTYNGAMKKVFCLVLIVLSVGAFASGCGPTEQQIEATVTARVAEQMYLLRPDPTPQRQIFIKGKLEAKTWLWQALVAECYESNPYIQNVRKYGLVGSYPDGEKLFEVYYTENQKAYEIFYHVRNKSYTRTSEWLVYENGDIEPRGFWTMGIDDC
ncbi:hypothetical protein FIM05_01525 [SAR202 cluster bacterium AD-802-K11_MRT_200m]|nr:hypothetical protein [SAR202 cluster bacterium AD-802-K11_MRT_200m]